MTISKFQTSTKKRILYAICILSIFLLYLSLAQVSVQAAKRQNVWVQYNQKTFYYNDKGKKAVGLTKIKNKTYYFNDKGVQCTGWQKIGNQYYFFKSSHGKKAYLMTSCRINGVWLDKKGRAKQSAANLRKLKIMYAANQIVEKQTKPLMPQKTKLRICFDYTKKTFRYATRRSFRGIKGWELAYAEDMFYYGSGNCFSYAAAFAFLANAIGYEDVNVISSGGHGWAEVNGRVYDPDWALVSKIDSYFDMPYSLSGVQGRPNYARYRTYIAPI